MTGFGSDWLALREHFDATARSAAWPELAPMWQIARNSLVTGPRSPFSVVDLACGTGANLRTLAPRIGGAQRWRMIDHDPVLLRAMPGAMAQWARQHAYRIETFQDQEVTLRINGPDFSVELVSHCADLLQDPSVAGIEQAQLVTASALLDLVSVQWLERLIRRACKARILMLFALNVDGRTMWDPADEYDTTVHRLFGSHQLRDKGFGPALGPLAVTHVAHCLSTEYYAVGQARSDWVVDGTSINSHMPEMLSAMIEGFASAAIEQQPDVADAVQAWRARRLAAVRQTRLTVGHLDVMALPTSPSNPGPTIGPGP